MMGTDRLGMSRKMAPLYLLRADWKIRDFPLGICLNCSRECNGDHLRKRYKTLQNEPDLHPICLSDRGDFPRS